MLEAIDRWWAAFAENADRVDAHFNSAGEFDLPRLMSHLQAVDDRLMWEFGPAVKKKGHRLCITPEMETALRPLLDVLLDRAPKLTRWEFYPYRLADNVGDDPKVIDGRTNISTEGVTVRIARGSHHRIDLTYFLPVPASEQEASRFAFVTTERLLGEQLLDRWTGQILVGDPPSAEVAPGLPLSRLGPTVESVIDSIISQLPAVPRYKLALQGGSEGTRYSALKWKPSPRQGDYPGWSDQFVAVTPEPALWKAAHSGGFYSERFSRSGETFCYLKIDGRAGLDAAHFADRGELENAITAELSAHHLGCAYGGGTGSIYSYIELVLADVERSIPALRDLSQRGNLPKRSWLLFHDCMLASEWIGLRTDTPPPPRDEKSHS